MGLVVCCITLLLAGGVSAEETGQVISLQQEAEDQLQKEIGAFEITAHQREIAKTNEAGYSVLDAGRGNPNWINTQARYAYTRFSDFATRECELDMSQGSMAGHARQEGIHFRMLTGPLSIEGDGNGFVKGMKCIEMELGEPDEKGRRRPVPIQGSEFELPVETVIVAIGNSPNPLIKKTTPDLPTQKWGGIITDEMGRTGKKNVYAGGDAVTGAATVILAMGAGKKAAAAILEDHP
jgi:NADPH-dependent glutamate synthase beta subunit-like oxidoreductase